MRILYFFATLHICALVRVMEYGIHIDFRRSRKTIGSTAMTRWPASLNINKTNGCTRLAYQEYKIYLGEIKENATPKRVIYIFYAIGYIFTSDSFVYLTTKI